MAEELGHLFVVGRRRDPGERADHVDRRLDFVLVTGQPPHHRAARALEHVVSEVAPLVALVLTLVLPDLLVLAEVVQLPQALAVGGGEGQRHIGRQGLHPSAQVRERDTQLAFEEMPREARPAGLFALDDLQGPADDRGHGEGRGGAAGRFGTVESRPPPHGGGEEEVVAVRRARQCRVDHPRLLVRRLRRRGGRLRFSGLVRVG
ncbi:hypothetical protein AB0G60_18335 [Streptomyces angustmyceticus]|uniref:hypothetical protein n=1 Tax=Streptomyces angustmyceticus TaxID=285578 RepID=UPI001CBC6C64|nr:hypothetical protein [Streptomyces angustmyceticus]